MAFTLISELTSTPITLNSSDEYLLLEGITHYSSISPIDVDSAAANVEITILGTLVAPQTGNVIDSGGADNVSITVGVTGSIISSSDWRPINAFGDNMVVTNHGQILGAQTEIDGDNSVVINSGTFTGTSDSTGVAALQMFGNGSNVINSGIMQSSSGWVIRFSGDATVINTGQILGTFDAIDASALTSVEDLSVTNSGTISAIVTAIEGGSGADTVENTGTIIGDVLLDLGDDVYRAGGEGIVVGIVDGGAGSDTLIGGAFSDVFDGGTEDDDLRGRGGEDELSGGLGEDVLNGGTGEDILEGGGDDDLLLGGADDDLLFGDGGEDTLRGGTGDDEVNGGDDNDVVVGNNGDDVLAGDAGDDVLIGGVGDDSLVGGTGRDVLRGGDGADTFIFEALGDSGTGAARDVINGFTAGEDLIDLRDIAAGSIDFLGAGAFSGTGSAELRLTTSASGLTIVSVDEDGNGTTDFQLTIRDLDGTLTEDDFLL